MFCLYLHPILILCLYLHPILILCLYLHPILQCRLKIQTDISSESKSQGDYRRTRKGFNWEKHCFVSNGCELLCLSPPFCSANLCNWSPIFSKFVNFIEQNDSGIGSGPYSWKNNLSPFSELFRPRKEIPVFPLTCPRILGSVGRKKILFLCPRH
jgi:hypothetical protein